MSSTKKKENSICDSTKKYMYFTPSHRISDRLRHAADIKIHTNHATFC